MSDMQKHTEVHDTRSKLKIISVLIPQYESKSTISVYPLSNSIDMKAD